MRSAWGVLPGVEACEAVGVDEVVATYAPKDGFGAPGDVDAPTGEVTSTVFLRTPEDPRAFARERPG